MKAISVEHATGTGLRLGLVSGLMARRSVPREMIGRKLVLHVKRTRETPAMGVGYVTFGEAIPQLNGDCWWPVLSFESWDKAIPAPGRRGFWAWSYEHG